MALNGNYIFEDLGEVKCSIIEKNCSANRTAFLKKLLEFNGFTVVTVPSPPPKAAPKPAAAPDETTEAAAPPTPETFTVGVTDLTFNPINGVYNRQLKTPEGTFVTVNYWKQRDNVSRDDQWYWKS